MTLTCPDCKNQTDFTAIGQLGKMQCFKCKTVFSIDKNYTEAPDTSEDM